MKFDPAPGNFQPIVDRINGVPLYTCMYNAVFPMD